jgi:cell wall-associated NlpC family hydrolase
MKLRALLLLAALCSLAQAAGAAADGPVFTVVPNAPAAPTTMVVPPTAGVLSELADDRQELARARATRQRLAAAAARAEARAASAPLLSDQLDAERAAAQLRVAADNAAADVAQLQEQIDTVASELQPVAPSLSVPLAAASTSSIGQQVVAIAERYLGVPYRWGGADPMSGFDCSGLTMYVYGELGVQLRHYAADQWSDLPHVDPAQLEPGDLVFFEPRWDGPGHVGIYAGGDSFIEAPHSGAVVRIASLSQEAAALGFVGAARPLAAIGAANPFGS